MNVTTEQLSAAALSMRRIRRMLSNCREDCFRVLSRLQYTDQSFQTINQVFLREIHQIGELEEALGQYSIMLDEAAEIYERCERYNVKNV